MPTLWSSELRPKSLNDFFGQSQIIKKGKFLYQAIESDQIPSMILWGPPGSGKTTIAHIIKNKTKSLFLSYSATTDSITKIKKDIELAEKQYPKIIVFIDEIHRFNKKQQDFFLGYVESGHITIIGATTENPSFEVNSALLSRTRVFITKKLKAKTLKKILQNILKKKNIPEPKDEIMSLLTTYSNQDARIAINALQLAIETQKPLTESLIKEIFQTKTLIYDKNGEEHYNIISALHKSMRGSDVDASLYWLFRMIAAGEDPLYIARRLIRFASEDIGLVNNSALMLATSTYQACHYLGYPECDVHLAHCVAYLAKSKKSNAIYAASKKAKSDVALFPTEEVPLHLRNAPTKLMKKLDYGKNYKYPPDYNYKLEETYFPKKLKNRKYLTS